MARRRDSITVGTRGSTLARTQTETVVRAIRNRFPHIEIVTRVISTEGDRVQDRSVSQLGDKGIFVRNIEVALLSGSIDLAVHSLKDVPSDESVSELRLVAFPPREDARDVVVSRDGKLLRELAPGATIGTGSLRRRVQLRAYRADVETKEIRGNVDTRLRKLHDGDYDALILAAAGLLRLGLGNAITEYLPIDLFTPDAGQGILAIQMRRDDWRDELIVPLDDRSSRLAAVAERACVRALGADCRSPVGAYATVDGDELLIVGMAAREDGSELHRDRVQGSASDSPELGRALGTRLLNAFSPAGIGRTDPYTEP